MAPSDPAASHRPPPLELLFDLTFAAAVGAFGTGLVAGRAAGALVSCPLVFFAIWRAWMNFT